MKRVIALILMLPSLALAQTQDGVEEPKTVISTTTGTEANPAAALKSTAKVNYCGARFYPPAAIAAHEEGTVILFFRIGADGSTKNIGVSSTSGFPDLDLAAVACAAEWKYRPAIRNGQPVEVDWKSKVHWMLHWVPNP